MGKVHIELNGLVEEKARDLANVLQTSIQNAATKLILSVVDTAIENVKIFNSQFDETNKRKFLEVYNGTLENLNNKKRSKDGK